MKLLWQNLLGNGLFEELSNKLVGVSEDELDMFLSDYAAREENICAYAFILFLIGQRREAEYYSLARMVLNIFFFYLIGASFAAYSCLLLEIVRNPDDLGLMESQLFYFGTPDSVIEPWEAYVIAQHVSERDETSEVAKEILLETRYVQGQPVAVWGEGLSLVERIKVLIEKGRFPQALNEVQELSFDEVRQVIVNVAQEKNICAYAFVWALLWEKETSELHQVGAELFATKFATIKGAVAVRSFHERRERELRPDV